MPRRRYNPDGSNDYTAPKNKPPRYDLRRKHKTLSDPLDKQDHLKDDDMKLSEEEIEVKKISDEDEILLAKKIALKRIKTAGEVKHIKDNSNTHYRRENLANFDFNENGLKSIVKTYDCLATAFASMSAAANVFNKIKSSQISPDGKIGGTGFILEIKSIRNAMSEVVNNISGLIDTFYDEINSPYWQKKNFEDPEKKQEIDNIKERADNVIDQVQETL